MLHDNDSVGNNDGVRHSRERRSRNLTDEDIEHIVRRINASRHLDCRFEYIKTEDLEETIKFYKNFNKFMSESGNTIWKAFLVIGLGVIVGLVVLGIYAKIKQGIGLG